MSLTVSPSTGTGSAATVNPPVDRPAGIGDHALIHSSVVHISAAGSEMAAHVRTRRYVDAPAQAPEIEAGKSYTGTVTALREFGAFIEIAPGRQGLLHISELTGAQSGPADAIHDYLQLGQSIEVEVTRIDTESGRIWLALPSAADS